MKTLFKTSLIAVLCAVLFSFSSAPGGDHYRVYLDDKLVLEQFVHLQKAMPSVSLDASAKKSVVSITYSHCGQTGTARKVSIRDARNKIVKEWQYLDAPAGSTSPMTFTVKDIAALKAGQNLNLFYSSREIPEGKQLASIVLTQGLNTAMN